MTVGKISQVDRDGKRKARTRSRTAVEARMETATGYTHVFPPFNLGSMWIQSNLMDVLHFSVDAPLYTN